MHFSAGWHTWVAKLTRNGFVQGGAAGRTAHGAGATTRVDGGYLATLHHGRRTTKGGNAVSKAVAATMKHRDPGACKSAGGVPDIAFGCGYEGRCGDDDAVSGTDHIAQRGGRGVSGYGAGGVNQRVGACRFSGWNRKQSLTATPLTTAAHQCAALLTDPGGSTICHPGGCCGQ